ncbi:peptidase family M1-domain-containing protein, partial [Chytriomyces sp. MP71]
RDILPGWLVPSHYDVWLAPSLESFTFDGTIAIDVDVKEDTFKAVLNAKDLTVHKASVTVNGEKNVLTLQNSVRQDAIAITYDKEKEQVTFEFANVILAGNKAVLYAEFTGIHNDKLHGFYRSSYNDTEGNKRHLVVTQFEACDARAAFPSYDEPALKATFDCTLIVDADLVALSNMNEVSTVPFVNTAGKNVKEVKFARTPIMSTYLIAFCVGDFESIETIARPTVAGSSPITVRVYALKGSVSQGEFALGVAARTLEFFSDYFNEAYPLPKCDMVAIPDFSAGAMENWGLVTYRTTALLLDERVATNASKKRVAYVVAHELAHQWFGNLVTMSWWNDLWLNEGFATFVGWLATDYNFPEWDIWTGYITGVLSPALSLDAMRSSHPIDVHVKSANDIGQIFDGISYMKGSSLIRMLNDFLGGQVFMDGVRTYLQEFKYKNTVTADLWRHLSASSGMDVASLAHSWTKEMGYPLLTISGQTYDDEAKTLTVNVTQSRFLSGGDVKPEEDTVNWWVPITVVTHLTGKTGATKHVLSDKEGTITFPYDSSSSGAFWKLNENASGLYRVKYEDSHVELISTLLQSKLDTFSVGDRIMFVNDALQLATAGLGPISTALNTIKALAVAGESEYTVLEQIKTTLTYLLSITYREEEAVVNGVKQLGRLVFSDKVHALGFEFPEKEDYFSRLSRSLVIDASASSGDLGVQAELRSRFDQFAAGDLSALHPEIRATAYNVALSTSDDDKLDAVFEVILARYLDANTQPGEKSEILRALGATKSPALLDKLLNDIVFNQEIIRLQDFMWPLAGIASNCSDPQVTRPLLWQWFVSNYDKLRDLWPTRSHVGGPFRVSAFALVGDDHIAEVEAWVRGDGLEGEEFESRKKDTGVSGYYRAVEQTLEGMKTKTRLIERERDNLNLWIASNL